MKAMNFKKVLLLLILLVGALLLSSCSAPANNGEKTFTVAELAEFDGKDGNKAYIAVDGIVYDVTDVEAWAGGEHKGVMAGQDVTDELPNSPHDETITDDLTVVGTLTE